MAANDLQYDTKCIESCGERATELQRQDDLYEDGSFPMSFAYLHELVQEDGITEDYLATLQCARSQVQ
jgi:hypothetical protein